MVTFKGKQYEVKDLFVRGESKLAKEVRRLRNEDGDEETKADAAVEIVHLFTGIDKGDLNGSKLLEVMRLASECVTEYGKRNAAPETGNAETQA